jgi:acetoin utilization deacetylase AcuC-like enzyme
MPLGDHVVYSPRSWADIGPHVFPMEKYAGVHRRLTEEDGMEGALTPDLPPREELLRVHSAAYLDDLAGGRHTWRTEASELPISRSHKGVFDEPDWDLAFDNGGKNGHISEFAWEG